MQKDRQIHPAVLKEIHQTVVGWITDPVPLAPVWSSSHWETLKLVARVHGVGPLLHTRLLGSEWLPTELRDWLGETFVHNQARVARMRIDLQAILATFKHRNIPVMPLKGANLAYRHYPDPALRPMADLDLLVRPSDSRGALEAMQALGYIPLDANWKHIELVRRDNQAVVSLEFEHPDNPRKVDLHTFVGEMMGGLTFDITPLLWERAKPGFAAGEPAWLPHPDTLWLHLLIHLNSSIWGTSCRLIQLFDFLHVPVPEEPEAILKRVDPRFTYLSVAMLVRYFPGLPLRRLTQIPEERLPIGYRTWAKSLTLETNSYFGRATASSYLARLRQVYRGQPQALMAALRYLILPHPQEVWFARQGRTGTPGTLFYPTFYLRYLGGKIRLLFKLLS